MTDNRQASEALGDGQPNKSTIRVLSPQMTQPGQMATDGLAVCLADEGGYDYACFFTTMICWNWKFLVTRSLLRS